MKLAKSIFLAGELVDATNISHSDYYEKGLICPFCYEKVFFTKEFERVVEGKTVKVSASFRHHKGDPLECEARAKSTEGKVLLQVISSESRQQRKEIWQKYLWDIFTKNKRDENIKQLRHTRPILNKPFTEPTNHFMEINYRIEATDLKYIPGAVEGKEIRMRVRLEDLKVMTLHLADVFDVMPFYLEKENHEPKPVTLSLEETYGSVDNPIIKTTSSFYTREKAVKYLLTTFSRTWLFDAHNHWCIETPLPIHVDISVEVFHHLNSPENKELRDRIWIIACLFVEIYCARLANFSYLYGQLIKVADHDQLLQSEFYIDQLKILMTNIAATYSRVIFEIDWLKMSKLPWEKIIEKRNRMTGRGFGKVK